MYGFVDLIIRLIDRFGWPGAFLILAYVFVERHGTAKQKEEIIDRFFLGKDITEWYPLLILGILAVVVVAAQHYYCKRNVKVLDEEVRRLAEWKSAHQEARIDADLHHTEVREKE